MSNSALLLQVAEQVLGRRTEFVSRFKITIGKYVTDGILYDTTFWGYVSGDDNGVGANGEDVFIGAVAQVEGEPLGQWFYVEGRSFVGTYRTISMKMPSIEETADELLVVNETKGLQVNLVREELLNGSGVVFQVYDSLGTNTPEYAFGEGMVVGETHTFAVYKYL